MNYRLVRATVVLPGSAWIFVATAAAAVELLAASPAFTEFLVSGKKEGHLIGFAGDTAYESTDGGATWKKAVDKPKGGAVFTWSYDSVGDVFCAQTGSLFRYARWKANPTNQAEGIKET